MSNPTTIIVSTASRVLDLLGDLKRVSVVLYCLGVFLYGVAAHSYDEATTTIALVIVGIIASVPGSLLTGVLIKLGVAIYMGVSKALS